MTEAEWLACDDLRRLLKHLRRPPGDRKLRLFLCNCCRRVWHRLGDLSRAAVETAERFADAGVQEQELSVARGRARGSAEPKCYGVYFAYAARPTFADVAQAAIALAANERPWQSERAAHIALARDLFGNPFRPVSLDPAWTTNTIASLAHAASDERILPGGELDTVRLAVLCDALEDAGCPNEAILSHLRSPGPHVRGCWVIDLLLGKE